MYSEDDFLMLSGIQHFVFCRRQWALIHLEQQWGENERTVDGVVFHEVAHNDEKLEKRGDCMIARGLRLHSHVLGVSGTSDVVEFHRSESGITLPGHEGKWDPIPIEYKKGLPKDNNCDAVQVCAQAMCLEEMLLCTIPAGYLFYGTNRRRCRVDFTESLRNEVLQAAEEMHHMWRCGHVPKSRYKKSCNACSLKEICLPELSKRESVGDYISGKIAET